MAELTAKFFAEDLSPAEEAELEALLEASPSDATRMSDLALQAYAEAGLPEPRWILRPRPLGAFKWPLLALGAVGLAWAAWPQRIPGPLAEYREAEFTQAHRQARPVIAEADGDESVVPARPVARPAPRALALPPARAEAPKFSPARRGGRLGVVLQQARRGPVDVHVEDASGRLLRRLHQGPLAPGEWRFEWDGRDSAGRRAAAGEYYIEVEREGVIQRKRVNLAAKGHD